MKLKKSLTRHRERLILKSYGHAGLRSRWWKDLAKLVKHCLQCGGSLRWRFVRVESRHRFVCVDCETIAYQNPKIVAATLPVDAKGRVCLLRRAIEPAYGRWTHPAGYMELGESTEDAALRETWEEIRARAKISGPPKIYSYPDAAVVTILYPARLVGRPPTAGPESLEVKMFSREEIPWQDLAFRSTFHALKDWVQNKFEFCGTKKINY